MPQTVHRLTAGLLTAALLSGPALAAPLRDAASGLAVNPPPGYEASVMPAPAQQTARFQIKRADDRDTGCMVAFSVAPHNAQLSQAQINQLTLGATWQEIEKKRLSSAFYDVLSAERFELDGLIGVQMVADFKVDPRLPPRSRDLRSYFFILETPRGRTSIVCACEKASVATRAAEFTAVARSTTPPR